MEDDVPADEDADSIDHSVEDPDRPFESWFEGYAARSAQPESLEPAGRLGAECRAAAQQIADDLSANATEDRWRRFTRKLGIMVFDAYCCTARTPTITGSM